MMGIFKSYVLQHLPNVLTQMDRDIHSKTYGSFDRNYWHLKIHDFSSAILQQSALTLALAYTTDFEGNFYFNNLCIKEWAIAGLRYMGKIQLSSGAFNEYYPNEHGFPPTAFNLFAGCYTYLLLKLDDKEILQTLHKAAVWLSRNDECNAYNQQAAALAGLALYYKIAGLEEIKDSIEHKLNVLLRAYCEEGWLPEQGGADIGYLSVTLDMLAEYYRATDDGRVVGIISGIINFLSYFIHPNGTVGGEYGSRNTIYFMPAGFENSIACEINKHVANRIVSKVYGNDTEGMDFMLAVDERYNTHYVMHSYLRAVLYAKNQINNEQQKEQLPFERECWKVFPKAGLVIYSTSGAYVVISSSKGGIVKVYNGVKEVLCDCGYRIPMKPGRTAATNWLSPDYELNIDGKKIRITGNFHIVSQKVQTPIYMVGLRIAGLFLGKKVNTLLKKLTIYQKKSLDVSFTREIRIDGIKIEIEDRIKNPQKYYIEEASNISLRLVASGNFFSHTDILMPHKEKYGCTSHLHRVRIINLAERNIETVVENGT